MGETTLYDEDVYAWSEQQAAALRRLATRRDLPNELDLTHVADAIEDVGAIELHAARSFIRLILVHAIKSWADAEAPSLRHWAAEIGNWHDTLIDRLTPAMRPKIDMNILWRRAMHQADLDLAVQERHDARALVAEALDASTCPIALDDLTIEQLAAKDLVGRIETSARRSG
ncbi:MAG TPA: DUF29 domain-containing protein [Acetobacteraceae bacterium]|jgi:hypothetical protein